MSDLSGEEERLRVRVLSLHHEYKPFVQAITALEYALRGEYTDFRITEKMVGCMRAMIAQQLSANDNEIVVVNTAAGAAGAATNVNVPVPACIRHLFDQFATNVTNIKLVVGRFNDDVMAAGTLSGATLKRYGFANIRALFCDLYTDEEMQANEIKRACRTKDFKSFLNPIENLKFGLIAQLFPNLEALEVRYLPLTENVLQCVFDELVCACACAATPNPTPNERALRALQSVVFKCERDLYLKQSTLNYEQCVDVYSDQFAERGWRLTVDIDAFNDEFLSISSMRMSNSSNSNNSNNHNNNDNGIANANATETATTSNPANPPKMCTLAQMARQASYYEQLLLKERMRTQQLNARIDVENARLLQMVKQFELNALNCNENNGN